MNEYLPLLLGLAGLAATALLIVWLVHFFNVRAGRRELQDYKLRVVSLSDKLDALKERHQLLPHTVQDFAGPMSGETLASYQAVAQRLEDHRRAWLQLMDAWEQAQSLLESERLFCNSRASSARQKLRAADAPGAMAAIIADCETPLERIEKAHAQAAADLNAYQQEDQQLGMQLESVRAASLALAPYEPERSAAAALVEHSQELLPADPLGRLRSLGEARGKIDAMRRLAAKILQQAATASELAKKLAEVQHTAQQRRSQGFLLREQEADPDPLLADARQQQIAVQAALQAADEAAAEKLLSQASTLIEQARQGIEQHVAARQRCESEIPARQAEARRLAALQAAARGQHAELARDFAADCWLSVADAVQRGQTSLAAADRNIAEAARLAAADVQQFLHAVKQLDQAAESHKRAQAELTSVGQRLRELVEQRAACESQISQVRRQSDQVHGLLQSNTADRALTNERFRSARAALDRLTEDSRQPRPDWARLAARAREIGEDLQRIEKLANEDIKLDQQAAAEIAEAERAFREARAFHEQGITPNVSVAESQLAQARGCLAAQGYEEAIRLAHAAAQMARAAHQDAVGEARRRQQQLEAQRMAEQPEVAPRSTTQMEV